MANRQIRALVNIFEADQTVYDMLARCKISGRSLTYYFSLETFYLFVATRTAADRDTIVTELEHEVMGENPPWS